MSVYLARRHDGWTATKQQQFIAALAVTRSVSRAAAAAGMSRKSAYALRRRDDGQAFAAAWAAISAAPRDGSLATPLRSPLDDIVTPVMRRGVMVGVRRRPNNRGILARLGALDRWVLRECPEHR